MQIQILGAGWYGCHLAVALASRGHDIDLVDKADDIFTGASGSIPARLHLGFHYPRSKQTRSACQEHVGAFMSRYGFLTAGVPFNVYAIAQDASLVDFDQYVDTLRDEVEFVTMDDPREFGIENCEGAVLTGERHILTAKSREYFKECFRKEKKINLRLGEKEDGLDDPRFRWVIDCTFCANESAGVDRYEPCVVGLLQAPTDRAVTIMDGPFHSLYPWDESKGLCSLSSALWTPISKKCRSYSQAQDVLEAMNENDIGQRLENMVEGMAMFYPQVSKYPLDSWMLSTRAMPKSGADTRLVDIVKTGDNMLRIRAGKIDAVIHAEHSILAFIGENE